MSLARAADGGDLDALARASLARHVTAALARASRARAVSVAACYDPRARAVADGRDALARDAVAALEAYDARARAIRAAAKGGAS